eukprot:10553274-Alexandrium_andersonii.AAC.1
MDCPALGLGSLDVALRLPSTHAVALVSGQWDAYALPWFPGRQGRHYGYNLVPSLSPGPGQGHCTLLSSLRAPSAPQPLSSELLISTADSLSTWSTAICSVHPEARGQLIDLVQGLRGHAEALQRRKPVGRGTLEAMRST